MTLFVSTQWGGADRGGSSLKMDIELFNTSDPREQEAIIENYIIFPITTVLFEKERGQMHIF